MASMFDIVRILISVVLISICALPDLHSSARKVKRDMIRRKSSLLERLIRRSPDHQSKSGVVRASKTPSWRWSLPALFALGSVASASSVKFPASLQLKAGGNIISMPEVSSWSWFPAVSTTTGSTFLSAPALDIKNLVAKLFPSSLVSSSLDGSVINFVSRMFPVGMFSVPASLTNPFGAVKSLVAGYRAAASEALAGAKRDALARCLDSWSKIRMLPVKMQAQLVAALPSFSSLARTVTSWSWSRPDDMFILAMSWGVGLAIILAALTMVMMRRHRRGGSLDNNINSINNNINNISSNNRRQRQRQRQRSKQKKTSSGGEEDDDTGSPPPPLPLRSSARISNKKALTNTGTVEAVAGAGTAAKKRPPRKAKKDKINAETTPPPQQQPSQPANLLSSASAAGMTWPKMFAAPITGE